jgi:glycosyltransferase involved in cell wall biosynthesis
LSNLLWPVLPALRLRTLGIDILHVHHLAFLRPILPAARLAGIRRVVCTEHSKEEYRGIPLLMRAARSLPLKVEALTVVADDIRDFYVATAGIPRRRVTVIRNGVDTQRFRPGPRTGALNELIAGHPGRKVVIAVGRLADAKDYPSLLAAIATLGDVELTCIIVGGGELHASITAEIARRGLEDQVILAGTRTDVESLLPGTDAYVLSSKHEGLPISLMEAMACGLPVVATRVGGVEELATNGVSGLVVPPQDPGRLAEALRQVLTDPTHAAALGRAARHTIEKAYSWQMIVREYEAVYDRIFNQGEERRAP